jgi:hypothetical protein
LFWLVGYKKAERCSALNFPDVILGEVTSLRIRQNRIRHQIRIRLSHIHLNLLF